MSVAQVIVLAPERELGRRIITTLTAAGCTPIVCDGRMQFQQRVTNALSAIVAVRVLTVEGWIPWLTVIAAEFPDLPLLVVTAKDADNLRQLAQIRLRAILYPSEIDELPALVRSQPFTEFFTALDSSIREARHIPLAVRRAMRYVVNQMPATAPAPGDDVRVPARTVKELAARLDYRPEYLSHLANASGIRLGRFIDWCIGLRAIELRLVHALRLDHIAWRLGFEYPSALSDFLLRVVGVRPSRITASDVPAIIARARELACPGIMVSPLAEPSPAVTWWSSRPRLLSLAAT